MQVFISKRDYSVLLLKKGGVMGLRPKNQITEPIHIMKKRFLRGFAIAAMTGFVLALRAQDTTTTDQSQYPVILQQPLDQCLLVGSPVTFSVIATNADTYQWYKNNTAIDGETNSSLSISSVSTNDAGYYSAAVFKGIESVPTRMANFIVYMVSSSTSSLTTTKSRFGAMSMSMSMSAMDAGSGSLIYYGTPVPNNGGSGSGCPGKYSGFVTFTKPPGYGWAPTSGVTNHTATDYNRSDTKVYFMGYYGDTGCNTNSVSISNPISPTYRFTIYFPTNTVVPTNLYPITLDGFDQ